MLKGAATLAAGRAGAAALRFARNVLLARLLPVEEYGLASTFVVLMAFVDMASDLALERLVVQDREGDQPRVVAAIQTLALLRGVLLAGVTILAAGPMADLFGHPELAPAFALFAAVPFLRGIAHLDMMREQREMRFGRVTRADLAGVGVSLVALWPCALVLGDHRIMLVLLLLEHATRSAVSIAFAERPFALGWDGAVVRRALGFGGPLLLSGLLAFATLQGDRVIVANQLGAETLGLFSAALTFAMTPCLLAGSIANAVFLPMLARAQDDNAVFARRSRLTLEAMMVAGAGTMFAFAVIGPWAFEGVFGRAYAEAAPLVVLLGAVFSLRLVRAGPTTAAMARGHNSNLLLANLARLVSLGPALAAVMSGYGVETLALFALAGEALALLVSLRLLHRIDLRRKDIGVGAWVVLAVLTAMLVLSAPTPWASAVPGWALQAPAAAGLICLLAVCRDLRGSVRRMVGQRLNLGRGRGR